MQLVLKYRIRLPRNLLLLLKTFIQTEALGQDPGKRCQHPGSHQTLRQEAPAAQLRGRKLLKNLDRDLRDPGRHLQDHAQDCPRRSCKQTAEGRQRLNLRHSGLESLDSRIEKGVNRLTVGLVISASLVAAALVLNSTQRLADITVNLFGIKTVPLTALFGLTGYGVATILGVWLIINIFRSGRL